MYQIARHLRPDVDANIDLMLGWLSVQRRADRGMKVASCQYEAFDDPTLCQPTSRHFFT